MANNSDPNTGPNPWTTFFGGGDPSAPPSSQGYGQPNTGGGSFASSGGGYGSGGYSGGTTATDRYAPDFATLREIEVANGHVYRLQKNERGYPMGYLLIGDISDLDAAAAASGIPKDMLAIEVQSQLYQQQSVGYNSKQLQYNTQHQDEDLALRDQQRQYDQQSRGYDLGTAAYTGGQSRLQYQQDTQDYRNQTGRAQAQYDMAHQQGDFHVQDLNRGYDTANREWQLGKADWTGGLSRQAFDQNTNDSRSRYNAVQSGYDETHQGDDNALRDAQRLRYQKDTAWTLAHQDQQQANDAIKLNQTGYEQTQGAKTRTLAGWGYQAMKMAQPLAGQ